MAKKQIEEEKTNTKESKDQNQETNNTSLLEELKEKIISLENTNKELTDKNMRVQAEFINFRTRTEQEKITMFKYEGENLIKQTLEVIDDFERAIQMDNNDLTDEVSNFLKGFKMIYTRLITTLENIGVKEIEVEGREFDPNFAEAILTEHDDTKPENVVLEVLKKGYMYKDKLIRPAMVKVNK